MANRIEPDTQKRLMIASAQHGGFIVCAESYDISTDSRRFMVNGFALLFAGSLPDCLDFMNVEMSGGPTAATPQGAA